MDRALNQRVRPALLSRWRETDNVSQNLILAFAGIVTGVTLWSIWNGDIFPSATDPKGDPQDWTEEQMKAWLNKVSLGQSCKLDGRLTGTAQRKLMAGSSATREELIAMVKAHMNAPV